FLCTQRASEVAEVVCCQWDIGGEGLTNGLAVFPGLCDGDFFQVFFDDVRDAQQHPGAFLSRCLAPGFKCFLCRVNRQVNICFLAARYLAENLSCDWGDIVHVFAVSGCDHWPPMKLS